jgi:hypothetical protein
MRSQLIILLGTLTAAFAVGCASDADESGLNIAPVTCEATNTCPAGSGGMTQVATGGAPSSGGYLATGGVSTGGVAPASGGSAPVAGGASGSGGAGTGGVPDLGDGCDAPFEFHARKDSTGAKFPVPQGTTDLYECFAYKVDMPEGVLATRFVPMIDNKRVVHHYLLYKMMVSQIDGATSPCLGLHRDGILVDGWAPGQEGVTLPDTVGMELGTGDFMIEIHYNNFGDSVEDSTGVKVCGTRHPRPNVATVSWLGTEGFNIPPLAKGYSMTSNCQPIGQQVPITIVRSWPHMHLLGRHMKADIVRANGTVETLFDKTFDFNSQLGYSTPAVINPGDAVKTTCTWDNPGAFPVTFGEGTQAEMCYNFTVAYPAYALQAGGLHSTSCND